MSAIKPTMAEQLASGPTWIYRDVNKLLKMYGVALRWRSAGSGSGGAVYVRAERLSERKPRIRSGRRK